MGRSRQPLVERTALVRLKMAKADVAQLGSIDEPCDGLADLCMHSPQPGVKKQGLVVFHQKMVELQIANGAKIETRKIFGAISEITAMCPPEIEFSM